MPIIRLPTRTPRTPRTHPTIASSPGKVFAPWAWISSPNRQNASEMTLTSGTCPATSAADRIGMLGSAFVVSQTPSRVRKPGSRWTRRTSPENATLTTNQAITSPRAHTAPVRNSRVAGTGSGAIRHVRAITTAMTGSTTTGRKTASMTARHTTSALQKKATGSREGRAATTCASRPGAGERSAVSPADRAGCTRPRPCVAVPEGSLTAPGGARRGARRTPPRPAGGPPGSPGLPGL